MGAMNRFSVKENRHRKEDLTAEKTRPRAILWTQKARNDTPQLQKGNGRSGPITHPHGGQATRRKLGY